MSQIRAQQAEVLQKVLSKVELAEKKFLDEKFSDVETILDSLIRTASSNPGNLLAAEAVMDSVPKMLVEFVADRIGDITKNRYCSLVLLLILLLLLLVVVFYYSSCLHVRAPSPTEKHSRRGTITDSRVESALELIESILAKPIQNAPDTIDIGWLSGAGTDAKALLVQNNVLRAGMTILRRKNTEVLFFISFLCLFFLDKVLL